MAITPYLFYEDVGGALKFLAKAFGFRKYGAQMLGPDGEIKHAAMQLGEDLIMMEPPGPVIGTRSASARQRRTSTSMWRMSTSILPAPRKWALPSSRNPRIQRMVIAVMVPQIPRAISGTSPGRLPGRNRNGEQTGQE